jgi:hypothetical protein
MAKQKMYLSDLYEKMSDLEFDSIMSNRNLVIDVVWETARERVSSMDPSELLELAEYHGLYVELVE